jgi:predicted nucleic acid-binding protein
MGIVISGTLGVLAQGVKRQLLTVEEADGLHGDMLACGYRSPARSLQQFLGDRK